MKKLIIAAMGSVVMMAGTAYAGCQDGAHAAAESDASLIASVEESDTGLLAKLKAQEELEQLEKLIETPPAYN